MTEEKQFYLCFALNHTEWLNFCCCWWPRWHQTPIPLYCSVQKSSTLLLLCLTKTQHYNFHRQNHTMKYSIFSYPRAQTGIRSWRVHWRLGHQRGWVVGKDPVLKYCKFWLHHTDVVRWCNGKAFGLAISRPRVQILLEATLRNNLRQVVYTYVPLSPSSITWYRPKGGDALRLGR